MPTESDVSRDLTLPTELRSVEAALSRISPADSNVDRDELMYRAGWEAARAEPDGSRMSLRIWQTAASLLAASLLLMLTRNDAEENSRVDSADSMPNVVLAEIDTANSESANSADPRSVPAMYLRSTAPLLVMRNRALSQDFSELPASAGSYGVSSPSASTSLRLIEEFLPRS